jgi:hypothetical protein
MEGTLAMLIPILLQFRHYSSRRVPRGGLQSMARLSQMCRRDHG